MAKILYVTESIAPFVTGGMQEVARRHIQYLRDSGHEVIGLHSRIEHEHVDPADMIRISWPSGDKWFRFRYPGKYARQLQQYSHKVLELAQKEKPDVIYAEGPVVDALLKMPKRPPIIFHPHGLEVFQAVSSWQDRIRLFPLKYLIKKHCRHSDIVISQGGRLTDILSQKACVDPSRVRILPNSFSGKFGLAKTPASRRFIFVGRREKRKGLNELLNVFSALPHLELDVIGSDQIHGGLANVRFHGVVTEREKMLEIYRKAHVLVVPSIAEGMPTVILESMSQGTPVIATDVGAVAGLVINKKTGWCIEPGNRNLLQHVMEQASAISSDDYRAMSANCIDLIRDDYSQDRVKTLLCSLIAEVIEEKA